jgi:YVTN family beta-propeller protein
MRFTLFPSLALLCAVTITAPLFSAAQLSTPAALPAKAAAPTTNSATPPATPGEAALSVFANPLPGMPPVLDPHDIYSETRAEKLSPVVAGFPARVYVPNTVSRTVDVIDPTTFQVVDRFSVGREPHHITPSYDLRTLWVLNTKSNSLTKIDPATGKKGETVRVDDPYNMYYTPDGKYALVVAEQLKRLDFRDPQTMQLVHTLPVPCNGVDHIDFSANGRYLIASCEYERKLIKVDVAERKLIGTLKPSRGGRPQDVKLSPDGQVFYVADMKADGVFLIDGERFTEIGFLPTGKGAHGLYVSRDSKVLYVTNRGEGTISLIDFATRQVVNTWHLPDGGSPDMGGVSVDGKTLWLSGRYHKEVYAIDTTNGQLLARIPVGEGPHGLCLYPQPGRYSLGHSGVFR